MPTALFDLTIATYNISLRPSPGSQDKRNPIPNATCSFESKLAGSIRSCTCHSTYRDVYLDVGSVNSTCLVRGSLSPPSINCTGPYIRLTTPSISTYTFQQISASNLHTISGGTSTVVFLVKACHDANFALHTSPNTNTTDVYEVSFGGYGNRKTFIGGECIQCSIMNSHAESSIVSCNEYRPFWHSWKNGVISAGRGPVAGAQTFMQWSPAKPIVINYVSISTYVNNSGTRLFREQ
ncbi:uncharacterized protein [Haliotis cracherodii]|uniref:uncharacterized protein n=1 Tax=Haliotis cracherodii TaxID=6455 RepID=UPI0039E9E0E4